MSSKRSFREKSLPTVDDSKISSEKSLPTVDEAKISSESCVDVNYQEEVVLLFYNSLLEYVVDKWVTIEREVVDETSSKVESIEVKDFRELSREDLENSTVDNVDGSKLSFSKGRKFSSSHKSIGKIKSLSSGETYPSSKNASQIKSRILSKRSVESLNDLQKTSKDSRRFSSELASSERTEGSTVDDDLILQTEPEEVIIVFKNGNCYEGFLEKKRLHGNGVFTWSDGVVYEGEFKNGNVTGKGKITYADNSYYFGSFCNGLLNGEGCMYVQSTDMIYSGNWKDGKKHGKGWLLYTPGNWYDGEWCDDMRQGFGLRQFEKRSRYQGEWHKDKINGDGTMVWSNSDYYKGEWLNGIMNGYGEYIWKTFLNKTFTFPIKNMFQGYWENGMRNGTGLMHFGFNGGARMAGKWARNMKHGEGIIVCGNGKIIQKNPLFLYDKPVYLRNWQAVGSNAEEETEPFRTLINHRTPCSSENVTIPTFPKTLSMQLNPICIPVHSDPKLIDISFYLRKVKLKLYDGSSVDIIEDVCISDEHELIASRSLQDLLEFEENKMRLALINNYVVLQNLYHQYATIATHKEITFRPVMIRLFLWQLYLDIGISSKGHSLMDMDMILNENSGISFETDHDPFELVYFWQFLLCLISTAWVVYSDSVDDCKSEGILAKIFVKFLYKDVLPNAGKLLGMGLCEYKNMLPIKSVYSLYKSLGQSHTVRDFFTMCMRKGWPVCVEKVFDGENILPVKKGKNIISVGENFTFLPRAHKVGRKPPESASHPYKDDMPLKNLSIFSALKAKQLVLCIAKICPAIVKDGVVVNMTYDLSFLEFLNVILLCARTVISVIKNREKKQQEREQRRMAQLENGKSELNTADTVAKGSRQSKKNIIKEKKNKK